MTARTPRRLLLAAGLVGTLALAAGSSSSAADGGAADEPVEITWYPDNYGTAGIAGEGTHVLLDAFAKAHPEVKLIPQAVPSADILTKTRADVAAGNAPDVVQMGYSKVDEAKKTLPLQPLDEIAGDAWETHTAGINPGLIETGMWEGAPRSIDRKSVV